MLKLNNLDWVSTLCGVQMMFLDFPQHSLLSCIVSLRVCYGSTLRDPGAEFVNCGWLLLKKITTKSSWYSWILIIMSFAQILHQTPFTSHTESACWQHLLSFNEARQLAWHNIENSKYWIQIFVELN